ncbi:hypothetical protein [Streptomyces nigra]
MAFREGGLLFSQPAALPPQTLARSIPAIRGLDMDEVRARLTAQRPGP